METEADRVTRSRVLCVDDDPLVAGVLSRVLRSEYDVVTVDSAVSAIEAVAQGPPFAVVISDYRMPGMDGVTLLGRIRELAPETVRVLLTGNADLETAIVAVNHGQIFRFLEKPCAPGVLVGAIAAASDLYRLVTAERVLLEQTVRGSIKALVDILALAQPQAFGRATRVRRHAGDLAERANELRWPIEIAAMLSQVGCTALPSETIERFYAGHPLTADEQTALATLPATAERLIAGIPRLDAVCDILHSVDAPCVQPFGAIGRLTTTSESSRPIPVGSRILKIALDFDLLEMRGITGADALKTMRAATGRYEPTLLAAFSELRGSDESGSSMQQMRLSQVRVGMVFASDVHTETGMLLVARGQEVSGSLVDRIRHRWDMFAGKLIVTMLVPTAC